MAGLTPKQEAFCAAYLSCLRFTEAWCDGWQDSVPAAAGGYYVYLLVDPRDDRIFYVGKGKGKRIFQHALDAKRGRVANAEKHKRIVAIHQSGAKVVEVFFHGAATEAEALMLERQLIRLLVDSGLTNISGGAMTNAELAQERAKAAMGRLKSFDRWLATARKDQIRAAERTCGSARNYYDQTRATFARYAAGDFAH